MTYEGNCTECECPPIEWVKEPESTRDYTDAEGFLHWKSKCGHWEIRYLFHNGQDQWSLTYTGRQRKWTRLGIAKAEMLKRMAENAQKHFQETQQL
jgi:hypothetical protein